MKCIFVSLVLVVILLMVPQTCTTNDGLTDYPGDTYREIPMN